MVKNCWKKIAKNRWENKELGNVISIGKSGYVYSGKDYAQELYWDFYLPNGKLRGKTPINNFKNNSEALKGANSYIKKHGGKC